MFDDDNKNDTTLTDTKSTKLDVERSKREESVYGSDPVLVWAEKKLKQLENEDKIRKLTGMRCSEHCGNTVREVQ